MFSASIMIRFISHRYVPGPKKARLQDQLKGREVYCWTEPIIVHNLAVFLLSMKTSRTVLASENKALAIMMKKLGAVAKV